MSNESRGHYNGDGNLVPSPRCGLGLEINGSILEKLQKFASN